MKFQNFPKQSNYRIERFRDIPLQKRLHKILKQTNSADKPASRMSRQSRKIIYKLHHLGGVLCRLCSRCSYVYLFSALFPLVFISIKHVSLNISFLELTLYGFVGTVLFFCRRQTFVPRFLATVLCIGAQIKMASTAEARVLPSTS